MSPDIKNIVNLLVSGYNLSVFTDERNIYDVCVTKNLKLVVVLKYRLNSFVNIKLT